MAVNRETIEIALSGLNRIDDLERRLVGVYNVAQDVAQAIGRIGDEIEGGRQAFARLNRFARTARGLGAQLQGEIDTQIPGRRRSAAERRTMQRQRQQLAADERAARTEAAQVARTIAPMATQRAALQRLNRRALRAQSDLVAQQINATEDLIRSRREIISQASATASRSSSRNTTTLFRRRIAQANRLATGDVFTGQLAERASAIQSRIRGVVTEFRSLGEGLAALRRTARAAGVETADQARERATIERARRSASVRLGRLNEELLEIRRLGRGRRDVASRASSLQERIQVLRETRGVSAEQLRAEVGGPGGSTRRPSLRTLINEAEAAANFRDNIGQANDLLDIVNRRLKSIEGSLSTNDKITRNNERRTASLVSLENQRQNELDREDKRLDRLIGLQRKLNNLRASGASGVEFERAQSLVSRLRPLEEGGDVREFQRVARRAGQSLSFVEQDQRRQRAMRAQTDRQLREAQRGYPASPVMGAPTMEGSPRWIAAQRRIEAAQRKEADKLLRQSQTGYPSSPILGTASMQGSPRWKREQERVRNSAERALRAQERAANLAQKAADKDLKEAQRGYPSSPLMGTASMQGSPRWRREQERVRASAERVQRAQERANREAQKAADKVLLEAQKGYPSSPLMGAATMEGSPKWKAAQDRLAKAAERRAIAQKKNEERIARSQERAAKAAEMAADRALREAQKGYPSSPIMGTITMEGSPRWKREQERLARISNRRTRGSGAGTGDERSGLSNILNQLVGADREAIKFRGGRSGEQALSSIVEGFNRVTAPLRQQATARGQDMPAYSGPEAGREREIDRYRGIFAGLTNNPRFFNRLLQQLPREAITTTMAGRASDISRAIEDSRRPDRKALESSIRLAYKEATGRIPSAVTELFDRIGSVFDSIANRVTGGTGGIGGGGGRRPPIPPGGAGPEDFPDRINAARGDTDRLLGLKDLANLSAASANQLELLSQALSETRNGLKMTDKGFDQLTKVLNKVDDQIARRDPSADFLTRRFGRRGGQAVGEGLIGGAFPLLFGQGAGAAVGGGLGGALGGFAGGTLGFGLSLAGTALGSAFDTLVQTTQDTGNVLRDLTGNFEQIKESGLLASRSQEKLIANLLESGNKTAAYSVIQDELNRKIGVDGASRLKEAADAGDRMKRAMADLGVQLQLFIAGPLADFLNKLAEGLGRKAEERRFENAFANATPQARAAAEKQLQAVAEKTGAPRGTGLLERALGRPIGGGAAGSLIGIPTDTLKGLTAELLKSAKPIALTPQEKRDVAIRNAETGRDVAQRQLDALSKRNEGFDILKGFKQQANAARREQEDIDRQSFELRRDYEKQIEDIRRGIEEKIAQLRQENAQKELEILVKQGQIREQQFKNAALAIRNELAGDDLAQSLADAVTSYLGAQLSAQNEIEQRRKQFEIEISNQQIELEKYKGEIARNIAQLNLSTAEKVQEINRGVARRNEDAALNIFATEKETAQLRIKAIRQELEANRTVQQADLARYREQLAATPFNAALLQAIKNTEASLQALGTGISDQNKILDQLEKQQAPARLKEIAPISARGVSTAGVSAQIARGTQLQRQILDLGNSLTRLGEAGALEEFIGKISELAQGSFQELEDSLNKSRKALGLVVDDFSITERLIQSSYERLIAPLARDPKIKLTPELLLLLNTAEKVTIELEKVKSTIQFYADSNNQLGDSITRAKDEILGLLAPVKEYDKWLEIINSRGGLGINPEQEQQILRNAKALDNLNAKVKVLGGLRDIASGWTDSFVQFNKELLKGGNLLESVQRFAEGVADRTLDVLLEFTLRPLEDQIFKNLADLFGIEKEKNPLLQPINAIKDNTDKLLTTAIESMRSAGKAAGPAAAPTPANGIVPGPGGRAPATGPSPELQWYRGAQSSAVPAAQFTGIGGPDLPMTGKSIREALRLTDEEIAAAVNTAIGEYGGPDPLGRTDVFANILSRSRSGKYPSNLVDVVTQAGQYAPNFGLSRAQVINPNRYGAELFSKVKSELLNPELLQRSIRDVNGRLYFKGVSQYPNMMQGDFLRAEGQNFFHGPGRETGLNPQITSKLLSEIGPVIGQSQATAPQFNAEARVKEWTDAFIRSRDEIAATYGSIAPVASQVTESMTGVSAAAQQAAEGLTGFETQMSDSVTKFQRTVGAGLQAISSIAMGVGGVQMIRKGGAYNTLMGAASIFGSISSITGMFGTGGVLSGLFGGGAKSFSGVAGTVNSKGLGIIGPNFGIKQFARGGRPDPYELALVGENGPEIWMPDRPGTIIPNEDIYVPILDDKGSSTPPIGRYARRNAGSADSSENGSTETIYTGNYGRTVPYQRSETTREIDRLERITTNPKELPPIKYETTRVNEYDFVTPEQLEASNARTAKIARNQTIRELADSMKTRKRLGL